MPCSVELSMEKVYNLGAWLCSFCHAAVICDCGISWSYSLVFFCVCSLLGDVDLWLFLAWQSLR